MWAVRRLIQTSEQLLIDHMIYHIRAWIANQRRGSAALFILQHMSFEFLSLISLVLSNVKLATQRQQSYSIYIYILRWRSEMKEERNSEAGGQSDNLVQGE